MKLGPRAKDLTGMTFGRLTVIAPVGKDKWGQVNWECVCVCGKKHLVVGGKLRRRETKSCGCLRIDNGLDKLNDLTSRRFGRLQVVRRVSNNNFGSARWECLCDCGEYTIVNSPDLMKDNNTKSCGCLQRETFADITSTHKMTNTPLYTVWAGMISRCRYETSPAWKDYGGRGIEVCKEWREDFLCFYNWAKDKYKRGLELDRRDVNGNYEAGNCRFVPGYVNASNQRKRKTNTSGYTGVQNINGRYQAKITSQLPPCYGKQTSLGYYDTKEEAVQVRNEFIKTHNLPHPIQEIK